MEKAANGYYKFAVWAIRIAYLNVLWTIFTLLGAILFGFMPATTATFAVTRKWVLKEHDVPIFKTFWNTYKKEFKKSNLLGFVFLGASYLLMVQYQILRTQTAIFYLIASYMIIFIGLLLFVIVMYFFPIYVHFDLKFTDYLKWPFVVGMSHPILTVVLLLGVGVVSYGVLRYTPGLYVFLGAGVTAYFLTWGVSLTYAKYTETKYVNN